MNADEIMRILRGRQGDGMFNPYEGGDSPALITSATLNAAADLIETLTAQLSASQARERAAAEEKGELLRERLLLKRCVGALSLLIKGLEGRAVMQVVLPGAKKALSAYRGEYPAVNVVLDGGGPQAGEGQGG